MHSTEWHRKLYLFNPANCNKIRLFHHTLCEEDISGPRPGPHTFLHYIHFRDLPSQFHWIFETPRSFFTWFYLHTCFLPPIQNFALFWLHRRFVRFPSLNSGDPGPYIFCQIFTLYNLLILPHTFLLDFQDPHTFLLEFPGYIFLLEFRIFTRYIL